jgi:hypothetical protein
MRSVLGAILLVLGATGARAQTFVGRVLDGTDSLVVSGAQVQVDNARSNRSNGLGQFRIAGFPQGRREIRVRMLGYAALTDTVDFAEGQTVTRDLYLTRVPRLLSQMVVKGKSVRVPAGFEDVYRRAGSSHGSFLTRETIDSLNARDVAGLLNEVPFIRVSANRDMPDRLSTSRCLPMIPGAPSSGRLVALFFNGVPITGAQAVNEILDHLAPSTIQAVEVYNGPTNVPPSFKPSCGAVAIWTRKG